MQTDKSGLIAHVQFLLEPDDEMPFKALAKWSDENEQIAERELSTGEARAGSRRELPPTMRRFAFPLLPGADRIDLPVLAPRAERLALILDKANCHELGERLFVGQSLDAFRA